MAQKSEAHQRSIKTSVRELVRKIRSILDDQNVPYAQLILFGSQARGDARPQSDIDLCIVLKSRLKKPEDLQCNANMWFAVAGIPADIIVVTDSDYRKNMISPILHEVRTYGLDVTKL